VPKELNALPPLLQGIEAILVLIFFFALVFDFEELLGTTIPPDLKIKLTDEELELIDKEAKKQGEEAETTEKERKEAEELKLQQVSPLNATIKPLEPEVKNERPRQGMPLELALA